MNYFIIALVLSVSMIAYLKWARVSGTIDKPNDRSSHKKPTVRGGGIIFPIALISWGMLFDHSEWVLISSVIIIGMIGFLDDRYSLHQIPRLVVQSISVILLLYITGVTDYHFIIALIGFILITGWLNTFNFMDGINGISVLYAISIMLGVYLFRESIPEVQITLIYVVAISLVIFGFVNVRINALAFAGDVGSLSLGLILVYFVTTLMISTANWEFIILFSVYGADSVLTIVFRLLKKENIFKAHRSHLYQYLANEVGLSHILVSIIYAIVQLSIILGLYYLESEYWHVYVIIILALLSSIYIGVRKIIFVKYI